MILIFECLDRVHHLFYFAFQVHWAKFSWITKVRKRRVKLCRSSEGICFTDHGWWTQSIQHTHTVQTLSHCHTQIRKQYNWVPTSLLVPASWVRTLALHSSLTVSLRSRCFLSVCLKIRYPQFCLQALRNKYTVLFKCSCQNRASELMIKSLLFLVGRVTASRAGGVKSEIIDVPPSLLRPSHGTPEPEWIELTALWEVWEFCCQRAEPPPCTRPVKLTKGWWEPKATAFALEIVLSSYRCWTVILRILLITPPSFPVSIHPIKPGTLRLYFNHFITNVQARLNNSHSIVYWCPAAPTVTSCTHTSSPSVMIPVSPLVCTLNCLLVYRKRTNISVFVLSLHVCCLFKGASLICLMGGAILNTAAKCPVCLKVACGC